MSIPTSSDPTFKPKKSVALSGMTAGNTALCSVGKTGNDLHYRGYDIVDLAQHCEFEEIAHLLIHERLPNAHELKAYKNKLIKNRTINQELKKILEQIPSSAHPMDIMRTAVSALGCLQSESEPHTIEQGRVLADSLFGKLGLLLR